MNIREKYEYAKFASIHAMHTLKTNIKGVSGVEFAIIAPLLVGIYLGVAETALGITNSRKVSRVAATLADLVSQSEQLSTAQLDGIMNASSAVMEPYSSTELKIQVVGVQMDANAVAKVVWSRKKGNTTAPSVDSVYQIPDDIRIADSFLIVTKVTYDYSPALGANIVDTFYFDEINYNVPRTSSAVELLP